MTESRPAVLVSLTGIIKRFPGQVALAGVDFDLRAGEIHALVGENGAGKSTLIKILSGVYQPDEGIIVVAGHPAHFLEPADAIRQGIATIYQERMLVGALTVAENISLGHEPGGVVIDAGQVRRRARETLDRLGLAINPAHRVRDLAVGAQQMVAIAKALTTDTRILILDEPTAALADQETERLFGVLRQLRDEGIGIVYITHRLEELPTIADRVTVLKDGRLVGTSPAASLTKDEVIRMMVGRELRALFPEIDWPLGEVVLRAEGLSRRGSLSEVSLEVRAGEILGLFGLIGSGTAELARVLYGADPLDAGRVTLNGRPAEDMSPQSLARRGVGFVPGDRKTQGLVLGFSVRHNTTLSALDLFSRFGFLDSRRENERATALASRLKVRGPSLRVAVRLLSGGNQQKVVIAKALCRDARVLVVDEPTWGIDVGAKAEIYHLLAELAREGAAIVVASSDLAELMGLCHRILVLRRGWVSGEFARGDFAEEAILHRAFAEVA